MSLRKVFDDKLKLWEAIAVLGILQRGSRYIYIYNITCIHICTYVDVYICISIYRSIDR